MKRVTTMRLDLTTPALLFPAISLLLLAHTNRLLVTATRLRDLGAKYRATPESGLARQLANLYYRIRPIRWTQGLGIGAMLMSLVSMLLTLSMQAQSAFLAFTLGLVLLMSSLAVALWEIVISVDAIKVELGNVLHPPPSHEQQHS
jgi:hypothetical protein